MILSLCSFKRNNWRINGTQENARNTDIPDFSSTMVPLPATYEAACISPRNNSTTLHMFSRYSVQILVTEKITGDVTTSCGNNALSSLRASTTDLRSTRLRADCVRAVPPTLSHRFNSHRITRGHLRHDHQLDRLHPLLVRVGVIRGDCVLATGDYIQPTFAASFRTIARFSKFAKYAHNDEM